ncbi:hypothetical protein ACN47E_001622 [Coniothyrium glycines]
MFKKEEPKENSGEFSTLNESEENFRKWFDYSEIHYARVGIFLKNSDGTEGDLVGEGGISNWDNKDQRWPEIFYRFKEKFWKKGYCTEFVQEFLKIWWDLPRKNGRIRVQAMSLGFQDSSEVKEQLGGEANMGNKGSIRVLEKTGFEFCGEYLRGEEKFGYWRYISPH